MNATDDWFEVEPINGYSYRIVEPPMFGMHLIAGETDAVVIDAGVGVGDLRGLVSELVDPPATMFLAHTHWDHIGAASGFDRVLVDDRETAPNGGVAIDGFSSQFVDRPRGLIEEWLEEGRAIPDEVDPESYGIPPVAPEAVETVAPGEEIDLGGRSLELYDAPGHSPGQLAALDREAGILYGSDVVHIDRGLLIQFEGCDAHEYVETLERLIDLRDSGAYDTLMTSHNAPISGDELSILERLRDGLVEILDGEREYELIERGVGEVRRYEVDGSPVFTKTTVTDGG